MRVVVRVEVVSRYTCSCMFYFGLGVTGAGLQQPVTALAGLLKASTASGKIMRQQSRGPANETGRDSSEAAGRGLFLLSYFYLYFYFILFLFQTVLSFRSRCFKPPCLSLFCLFIGCFSIDSRLLLAFPTFSRLFSFFFSKRAWLPGLARPWSGL